MNGPSVKNSRRMTETCPFAAGRAREKRTFTDFAIRPRTVPHPTPEGVWLPTLSTARCSFPLLGSESSRVWPAFTLWGERLFRRARPIAGGPLPRLRVRPCFSINRRAAAKSASFSLLQRERESAAVDLRVAAWVAPAGEMQAPGGHLVVPARLCYPRATACAGFGRKEVIQCLVDT